MSRLFKIFLLVVLSVFSTLNLSANDTFFSIEKQSSSVKELAKAGRKFTTAELALLKRADLPSFVSNNLDDLLLAENRTAIWNPPRPRIPSQRPSARFSEAVTSTHLIRAFIMRNKLTVYNRKGRFSLQTRTSLYS